MLIESESVGFGNHMVHHFVGSHLMPLIHVECVPSTWGLLCCCQAPTNHKTMRLQDRIVNAMCGFVTMDLLKIVAELECKRRCLPKGSPFFESRDLPEFTALCLRLDSLLLDKTPKRQPMGERKQQVI